MKVLAILQNTWVRDPDKLRAIYARNDEGFRRRMIGYLLFRGCVTGRRMKAAFGELCDQFIYEEISREITGIPSARVTADRAHIIAALNDIQPSAVLVFGRIAADCIKTTDWRDAAIYGPHPAARHATVPQELAAMNATLRNLNPGPARAEKA